MTQQTPYGIGDFTISGTATYTPSDFYVINEDPKVQVDIYESPITGKRWGVKREAYRAWEIILYNISQAEFESSIEVLRGVAGVTFAPFGDTSYTCDITYCEHEYFKGSFYHNQAIIKLQETTYQ
jgi:hypothetical protein